MRQSISSVLTANICSYARKALARSTVEQVSDGGSRRQRLRDRAAHWHPPRHSPVLASRRQSAYGEARRFRSMRRVRSWRPDREPRLPSLLRTCSACISAMVAYRDPREPARATSGSHAMRSTTGSSWSALRTRSSTVPRDQRSIAFDMPSDNLARDWSAPTGGVALGSSPSTGQEAKHQRRIVLATWQLRIHRGRRFPSQLLRGAHRLGRVPRHQTVFKTKLPSGRVASYEYPRYFILEPLRGHPAHLLRDCELLGIEWTPVEPSQHLRLPSEVRRADGRVHRARSAEPYSARVSVCAR